MTGNRDRDPRAFDEAHLLAPFNARQMIRLDGMKSGAKRVIAATYIGAQETFPTVDRNVTPVVWAVAARPGPPRPMADCLPWTVPQLFAQVEWSSRIAISGELLGTRRAEAAWRDRLESRYAVPGGRDGEAGRALIGYERSFSNTVRLIAPHEHGHSVLQELRLADHLFAERNEAALVASVQGVVPGYTPRRHLDAWSRRHENPDLLLAVARQGIQPSGLPDFDELVCEAFALYSAGYRSPLITAIGDTLEPLCGRFSPIRAARQERLAGKLAATLRRAQAITGRADSWPESVVGVYREMLQVEDDPRVASLMATERVRGENAVGATEIARLATLVDTGRIAEADVPPAALAVARETAATLAPSAAFSFR